MSQRTGQPRMGAAALSRDVIWLVEHVAIPSSAIAARRAVFLRERDRMGTAECEFRSIALMHRERNDVKHL